MANVIQLNASSSGGKKARKKLAKQEAKLMLKVEQARKDVQKAQDKATKAQTRLEDRQQRLQAVEEKLSALRTSSWEEQAGTDGNQRAQQEEQEQPQAHPASTETEQAEGEGETGVPNAQEPNQNPDEAEDRALPETPQPTELPDQHAPGPPDSQPYTVVAQDEALTEQAEPYSSTQP
jgi:hypothetical protein